METNDLKREIMLPLIVKAVQSYVEQSVAMKRDSVICHLAPIRRSITDAIALSTADSGVVFLEPYFGASDFPAHLLFRIEEDNNCAIVLFMNRTGVDGSCKISGTTGEPTFHFSERE